jgi:hypothetical protein
MKPVSLPLPFPFIKPSHPDWDDAAFYSGWVEWETQLRRVPIEWLVGVQKNIDDKFMTRPLNIPIRVCIVDGVYYVRDGHHRVVKARALGRKTILAKVLEAR